MQHKHLTVIISMILILLPAFSAFAEPLPLPNISLNIGGNADQGKAATVVQLLLILTVLSLAPAILLMLTSFTRILIVLSLLRHALGTQQMPANQIVIGLAQIGRASCRERV